jgi:hypothetical protein
LATTPSSAPPPARSSQRDASARRVVLGDSRRCGASPEPREQLLERSAPFDQRSLRDIGVRRPQDIERDQQRRRLGRELGDATRRRVQAHLQRLERQRFADRDDKLAIEGETPNRQPGSPATTSGK